MNTKFFELWINLSCPDYYKSERQWILLFNVFNKSFTIKTPIKYYGEKRIEEWVKEKFWKWVDISY